MLGAFLRLLILVAGGLIVSQLLSFAILAFSGLDFSEMNLSNVSTGRMRLILGLGHLFTFIIPCVLFAYLQYGKEKWKALKLDQKLIPELLILSFLFLLVCYPAVTYSYTLNSYLPLADWMVSQEEATAETLGKILTMESLPSFLINLLLIAILPAIGEELLFRGLLMDMIEKTRRNGHWAVWFSAAAFSLFHLQFQGFLPRLVLGAVLGYAFLYTRNLWVPILLHFLNNALPIVSLYFFDQELASIDPADTPELPWIAGLISILLGIAVAYFIRKRAIRYEV